MTMTRDDFCMKVYRLVREVPAGRVTTYGAIANAIGEPRAARRVGFAMRVSGDVTPPVPAHRVVSSSGQISCQSAKVRQFLANEKVVVKGKRIVDFRNIFWEPSSGC